MFGIKLPSLSGTTPKGAMEYLVNEAEKKLGKPVNNLIMEVDFETEKIVLKLPDEKLKETMESSFMFMIISSALSSHFDGLQNVQPFALIVHYNKKEPLKVDYYYIENGEKLHQIKELK